MRYKMLAASVLFALTSPLAQAMPVPPLGNDAQVMLVRDGCGPGAHAGRDGYCHQDHDWDRRPPPQVYAPPREFYPPPRYDDRYHHPRGCPPGFHIGRYSGVCKPNEDF